MTTLRLSYPELARTTPEMVRACGFSVGQADDVAEMLLQTEVLTGRAYAYLLEQKGASLNAGLRPRVEQTEDGRYLIDGAGLSLLQIGPRLLDLACGTAGHAGAAWMFVRDTGGALFLPYLARRAALRGYRAVLRTGGEGDARVVIAEPGEAGEHPVIHTGEGAAMHGGASPEADALATRLDRFASPHAGANGWLAIAVERATREETDSALSAVERRDPASGQAVDFDGALQRALQHGITMETSLFSRLGDLLVSLRVPSSERSRMQAG